MPDYVTMADINGRIPSTFLIQALDDDEDGSADTEAWAAVLADVHSKINGILGGRFDVPFANPLPPIVVDAAKTFACDFIYARRGMTTKENNPWKERAAEAYKTLKEIAAGKLPLTPDIGREKPSASAVTRKAKTSTASGSNLA